MDEADRQSVKGPWAALFARHTYSAVATLRLFPSVLACETADGLWLKGDVLDEQLSRALDRLAPQSRCAVEPDGQLRPAGKRVPHGRLPDGNWRPLREVIRLQADAAIGPAAVSERVQLRLVRTAQMREPSALLTRLNDLAQYVELAPMIRLSRLSFAADAEEWAIIRGTPLPPIPGTGLEEDDGILVPCGWRWEPHLPGQIVRKALGLNDGELGLADTDGSVRRILSGQFVAMTRPAVRQTREMARR